MRRSRAGKTPLPVPAARSLQRRGLLDGARGGLTAAGKFVLMWAVLVLTTAVGALIIGTPAYEGTATGPLTALQALLVVNGAAAVMLSLLAARLRLSAMGKTGVVFTVYFLSETGLSLVENIYFNEFLRMPTAALVGMGLGGALRAAAAGLAAGLLWPDKGELLSRVEPGLRRFLAIVAVYVLIYFLAGYFIAWQVPSVRAYYDAGLSIDAFALALVQVGRAVVWAAIIVVIAVALRGGSPASGLLAGMALGTFVAAPLLYPSAIMPWDVRQAHLLELFGSTTVFGVLGHAIWRRGGVPSERAWSGRASAR